jgi:outer membrane protein assembly factor BamB
MLSALSLHAGIVSDTVAKAKLKNGMLVVIEAEAGAYEEAAVTGLTVRGLESDRAKVAAVRKMLLAKGVYGKVSVTGYDGGTLPVIGSLVNVIIDYSGKTSRAEALRVLVPGGEIFLKSDAGWESVRKSWPKEMGEWNQYLCNADNNGVARDSAGPPERMQWTAGNRYGRVKNKMPSVTSMVTANGRIYTIEDMATTESEKVRKRYVLLARDAFNGCELWRYPLKNWDKEGLGPVKIIPVQLQRLMLAVGDRVYCTDGYDGPVKVFDGASGDILMTFANTENTREIAYAEGVIYGVKGEPYAYKARRVKIEDLKIDTVKLYACDAASGKPLWSTMIKGSNGGKHGYIGGTLSIKGDNLCYITRTSLVCRNSRSGQELWNKNYPFWADMPRKGASFLTYHTSPPTIVMVDEQAFCVELNVVRAYALKDGSLLWEGETECGYCKNGDLFYVDGLVWTGLLKGLDPVTGEIKRELEQTRTGPMCHPRCYRNRITHKYYINSKTGGTDLLSLDGKGEYPSPWLRATCGLAMTPSYGRMYSSPYVCACEIGSLLLGFNCLYTEQRDQNSGKVMSIKPSSHLVKGPAFSGIRSQESGVRSPVFVPQAELRRGKQELGTKGQESGVRNQESEPKSTEWPTYRHDSVRSGVTSAMVPAQQKIAWKALLPGKPTAPVVAGGLLLCAVKEMHTLYALDSETGKIKWTFTADGPVDSPPTYYRGLVLMGSRDGWVYCLDARSGQLVWKFSDMPDIRYMCAFEQLESAWPVNGSVMVEDDLAYFSAGRSSFLDGGIVVYALNPLSGELKHRQVMAGPYNDENFPINQRGSQFRSEGFRAGIFSSAGDSLFIRHQGFNKDLSPISPYNSTIPHLMSSTGFICESPQHRTYWTIDTDLSYGPGNAYESDGPQGDIIAVDGESFYEVRGYTPGRHSQWKYEPLSMYRVVSGSRVPKGMRGRKIPNVGGPTVPRMTKWDKWRRNWSARVPIAGHAILKAGDKVVVAGVPMRKGFSEENIEASYAGGKGGLLWTINAADGRATGEVELPAAPVWDGLAAVDGNIYVTLKDGTVMCLDQSETKTPPPAGVLVEGSTPIEDASKPEVLKPVKGSIWLYRNGFENDKVGSEPGEIQGADAKKGSQIVVTDKVAASGKHSLILRDAELEHIWKPLWQTRVPAKKVLAGMVKVSFDVMTDKDNPGDFTLILRHYGTYQRAPNVREITHINVTSENAVKVEKESIKALNGLWHHVEFTFPQGLPGKRVVKGTITTADGKKRSFEVPCASQDFVGLNWCGLAGTGEKGITYIDNLRIKLSKP